MVYVKHPTLGNERIEESELAERLADGWVRWPRTAEEKAGIAAAVVKADPALVVPEEPAKRGPGRPRKGA